MNITLWGSLVNALLIVLKFLAGIWGNSGAMIADAVHSLSDFVTDIVVLIFVRISGKPRDRSHDYGHGKFETLATAIISLTLIGVGVWLFVGSANKIYGYFFLGDRLSVPGVIALWMAMVSIAAKEVLFRVTYRVGHRVKSDAVVANAYHHRSDAYSSIATLVGIGGAIVLGPHWVVLEPLAAVFVCFFIIKVGFELMQAAIRGLSDASLSDEIEQQITQLIDEHAGVLFSDNLHTRDLGNAYAIEADIHVDAAMSVFDGHRITEEIEVSLRKEYGSRTHIIIHVEPVLEVGEKKK